MLTPPSACSFSIISVLVACSLRSPSLLLSLSLPLSLSLSLSPFTPFSPPPHIVHPPVLAVHLPSIPHRPLTPPPSPPPPPPPPLSHSSSSLPPLSFITAGWQI